ncbi:probable endonuclease 4 (Endonuclease IV)(Endodeoxyribonuclease IV) [Sulfurihydrogenibium azorense Az-Fu1]|uniref:Probable endonuclease 4 n=1 Tax=Sulfurihydrogenibium azorense (strain DSM 15241 / OCM 825 / Az-Fu1) TaxID=204536 RepID=C1DTR4_SULAA|nr:deoxyribonuclease IV [Sulfurihydrogenibium azorense]ACN98327.1 probable endonuclease 4 (Endonuclease IV)(Endodeoxyribonuclease IV) [Sulfurihydrogenibium azorense Az-Fu1]
MVNIGTHVSSSKSLDLVFDRGKEVGAKSIQFFLRSPRSWSWIERKESEKQLFLKKKNTYGINPTVVHASYLFNLASYDDELFNKSISSVIEELELCEELKVDYYVIHAGKTKGKSKEYGINRILKAFEVIFSKVSLKNTTFLVETLAGQSGEVGSTLEEVKDLIDPFSTEKLGVCLDTCHIFAAGYPIHIEEGFKDYKSKLQDLIGLEKVKVIHCNDSKTPFNSHKDRHEHIGKGFLGLKAFENFLNDEYFKTLPFILETPKEGNMDIINMNVLYSLVRP